MKKTICWVLLFSFTFYMVIGSSPLLYAQQPTKLSIAILTIGSKGGISNSEAATLSDRLGSMLVNTNAFIVLERGKMQDILDEQGFQQTGCTTTECAVEVGKMLNVQKMISGSIGKIGRTYTIDLSLIDVKTAQIENSFIRDYKGEIDGLLTVMESIADQIAGITGLEIQPKAEQRIFQISIKSNPTGARIFINNKNAGKTPFNSRVREGMDVEIVLKKENYKDWEESVSVSDNVEINATLEVTDEYREALAKRTGTGKGKGDQPVAASSGGSSWYWYVLGAVVIGGGVAVLAGGGGDDGGGEDPPDPLPDPNWPPQ